MGESLISRRLLALALLGCAACAGAGPAQPTPPPHAPPATAATPARAPAAAKPAITPTLAEPAHPAAAAPGWHSILDSTLPELELHAFDAGAVIAARSFLVVVEGSHAAQEPRWLRGLPEWVNWDASVYLSLPRKVTRSKGGLPDGTSFSAHAGNRHGPDFAAWWTSSGWSPRAPLRDARLARLPKPSPYSDTLEVELPSGELLALHYEAEVEAYVVPARGKVVRTTVPTRAGIRHAVVGSSASDLYLCESTVGVFHFDGSAWSEVDTDGHVPASCAATRDGTLWISVEARGKDPAAVLVHKGSEWVATPLPGGAEPSNVRASGDRVWVSATTSKPQRTFVFSNQPVDVPLTLEEADLPGPLWINGITGLDVTSVDVVSVSASPAGPGTQACTSLVAWLGAELTPELRSALGTPLPRVVEVAGVVPGQVAPVGAGAQMRVQSSGKKKTGIAAVVASYDDGQALVKRVRAALPALGARLLCAEPRVVRELK